MARGGRTVSALRPATNGRVAIELDGTAWRSLPVDAVAAAGLYEGCVLDRERLRRLARARRRSGALAVATRALARRPLSERELEDRLARRRVAPADRAAARRVLASAGYLDDARVAVGRCEVLAARGAGDELIRHDLRARGIAAEAIAAALATVPSEEERAREVIRRRGPGPRTARWLAAHGFTEDTAAQALESAIAEDADDVVG